MTREEALKISDKKFKRMMTDYQEYLEHSGEPLKEHEKWLQALNMAIEALRKQIPQKPYLWGDGYADGHLVYDMWNCPNCEKTYEVDYDEYGHCPACGQAIEWSEKE